MKPAARRLGRGLGAFLDFGPAGEDGASFVSEAIGAKEPSVLATSASAPPATAPAPSPAPREPERAPPRAPATPVAAAPVAAAPVAPAPTAPEPAFIDDLVVDLTFGDVELE